MMDLSGRSWSPEGDAAAVGDVNQDREVGEKFPRFFLSSLLPTSFKIFNMVTPTRNALEIPPAM